MSTEQLITDHLDLWTGAVTRKSGRSASQGRELTGIKKLRELILELAVRGKLVEQDPNDEPASVLLERIAEKKAQLVKEGKIKKPKKLPSITQEEKPFELPNGWVWSRLPETYYSISPNGKNVKSSEVSEEGSFPVIDQGKSHIAGYHNDESLVIHIPNPVIIFGDHTTARKYIDFDFVTGADGTKILCPVLIEPKYFHFSLLHYDLENRGYARHFKILNEQLFAIPPTEEQHRIVAKVDELMTLCDRLEQHTGDQLDAHEVLVDTLLEALTRAEDADEVAAQWARLAEHFDTLFTTEASIEKLKQAILQLAVMGRLVEQDPNDKPASVLVNAIIDERNRLKDDEGMRTKASDTIDEHEIYLSTPTHWSWIKLGNTAKFIDYRGRTPNKIKSGKRLITAKNIRQGYIDSSPEEFISEEDYLEWMTRGFPRTGDTLFTTEAPLGNVANINIQEDFALAQRAICFQWHMGCIAQFMLIQLMASAFQEQLKEKSNGMTATGIKSAKLKEIPVVLPPISEQHRIVARVDELMALCNQLKACLNDADETRKHLAKSVVAQAI
ncbi:type I restriction enzyme S subunit [Kushneria sinocarnis]|uniref:Type I restriction enzyme S subunit n=1 Tax=Kushneria sinocarnis TaxID=595502 RepID=A0A420WZ34_9GAMM|nr:restriction endonuclease subunit S [Kushneria sinocarnis]RKR06540.1 type I restriction enzyme S subunit [Kushneria sinocarnis]